jgi:hypothetical protein
MSDNTYSFDDKQKLVSKIQNLKKKKYFETIRDIILECNKNLDVTDNSNGLFLCFHNLSNDTYVKIDKFIKKLNKISYTSENSENYSTEYVPYSQQEYPFENNAKLRYSNKEKSIIKRKIYDKHIIAENNGSNNIREMDEKNSEEEVKNEQIVVNNLFVKSVAKEKVKDKKQ